MYCTKCGSENPENSKFCIKCGNPLTAPAQPAAAQPAPAQPAAAQPAPAQPAPQQAFAGSTAPAPKKKIPVAAIAAAAGAVVLVLIIVLIVSLLGSGSGYALKKGAMRTFKYDGKVFAVNGNTVVSMDYDSSYLSEYVSADGTAVAILDNSDLYYSKGDKFKKIDSDVESAGSVPAVVISTDGNTVYYICGDELKVSKNGGKGEKVADLEDRYLLSLAVSPDGNTAAYSLSDTGYSNYSDAKAYIYSGKTEEKDFIKYPVVSVSDGASVIYAADTENNKLLMFRGIKGEKESVASDCGSLLGLSSDNKGILFTTNKNGSENTYYYDPSLKDKIKVCGGTAEPVIPGKAYANNNFNSFLAENNGNIVRYTRKGEDFESVKIVSGSTTCNLSEDGSTIVYLKNSKLYRASTTNPDSEVKLATDVNKYIADSTLKHIYYYNSDEEAFFYVTGTEDNNKKVCDDYPSSFVVTNSGVCVYIYDNGSLGCSIRGSKEKVKGISEASEIYKSGNTIFAKDYDEGILYSSTDGVNFSKVK